jgi:hypothetical protein
MKLNLFASLMAASTLAVGALAIGSQPSSAQTQKFFCSMSREGGPATFVVTELAGNVELIRWQDDSFPPPHTPQQRCVIVSQRFQRFYSNGTLKFIKAAILRGEPILCVAAFKGGPCLKDGVLVTFKRGTNPEIILEQIKDNARLASGKPVLLSGDSEISKVNGEFYLDVNSLLGGVDPSNSSSPFDPNSDMWDQ